jgi:hypothetical protein
MSRQTIADISKGFRVADIFRFRVEITAYHNLWPYNGMFVHYLFATITITEWKAKQRWRWDHPAWLNSDRDIEQRCNQERDLGD